MVIFRVIQYLKRFVCKGLSITFFFFFVYLDGEAQEITISGTVKSDKDSSAIPYATILVKRELSVGASYFNFTDKDGRFSIRISDRSRVNLLVINAIGFSERVFVLDSVESSKFFFLYPNPSNLPEVIVKSPQPIGIIGDTITYRTDYFRIGNEKILSDILRNLPAIEVSEAGRIFYNGKEIDNVLVEGEDLVGKGYEQLVKRLGANGIDKIQVIDNYKDKNSLVSQVVGGSTKRAINIKYEKSHLAKLFGKVEAGVADQSRYNLDMQLISLFNRLKVVSFQSNNLLGNLANTDIFSDQSVNIKSETSPINIKAVTPIGQVQQIGKTLYGIPILSSNESNFSDISLQSKLNKKLTFNANIQYAVDKKDQAIEDVSIFSFAAIVVEQRQKRQQIMKEIALKGTYRFNYLQTDKKQWVLSLQNQRREMNNAANSFVFTNPFSEKNKSAEDQIGLKIAHTNAVNKKFIKSYNFEIGSLSAPGDYSVAPNNYDSFFFRNSNQQLTTQVEIQKLNFLKGEAQFFFKNDKSLTEIASYFRSELFFLSNEIYSGVNNQFQKLNTDSSNLFNYTTISAGLSFKHTKKISKKFSFNIETELRWIEIAQLVRNSDENKLYRFALLPRGGLTYFISSKSNLRLSFNSDFNQPETKDIASGYVINNLTTIKRGADDIKAFPSVNSQLFYSFSDFVDRGILFFSSIGLNRRPQLYIVDQYPFRNYSLSRVYSTSEMQHIMNLFIRGEKFIKGFRNRLVAEFQLLRGNVLFAQNGIIGKSIFIQTSTTISAKVSVKRIGLNPEIKYVHSGQEVKGQINNTRVAQLNFSNTVDFPLFAGLFLKAKTKFIQNGFAGRKPISLIMQDLQVSYQKKESRWLLSAQGTNLFNRSSIRQFSLAPGVETYNDYLIFPRVLMCTVQYSF